MWRMASQKEYKRRSNRGDRFFFFISAWINTPDSVCEQLIISERTSRKKVKRIYHFPTNGRLQLGLGSFFRSRCWREVRTYRNLADLGWGLELLQRLGLWAGKERHTGHKAYPSHSLLYLGVLTSLSSLRFNFIIYWIMILINRYFFKLLK